MRACVAVFAVSVVCLTVFCKLRELGAVDVLQALGSGELIGEIVMRLAEMGVTVQIAGKDPSR